MMMSIVNYHFKDYLTEASLGEFLKTIFGDKAQSQVKIGKRMSCDYCIQGPNGKLYIEFDGPHHYTSPTSAVNDDKKKTIIQSELNNVVRIPYFVQLDTKIWKTLFIPYLNHIGLIEYKDIEITTDWQHGFISQKIIYPASYCSLGVARFKEEIYRFDKVLDNKIFISLCDAAKRLGDNNLVFHYEP